MAVLQPYKDTKYYLWKYLPSQPGAAVFAALFALLTAWHVWKTFRTRSWFWTAFVIGGMCKRTRDEAQNTKSLGDKISSC